MMKYLFRRLLSWRLMALDVSYGPNKRMRLDIYGKSELKKKPVIMFWHGGSWKRGDKQNYRYLADYLESLGAIVVLVEYPLFPERTFPGFIDDARLAVEWVREHIKQYGGDPKRIFAMGHSAGAHTAVILTLQDKEQHLAGCISLAAPCTIFRRYWQPVFGDSFDKNLQNPITHIGSNKHPFLLVHGMADQVVVYTDGRKIFRALQKADYPVELISLKFIGHFRILTTLVRPFAYKYKVGSKIRDFIHAA